MLGFVTLVFTSNNTPTGAGFLGLAACTLIVVWQVLQRKRRRLAADEP